MNYKAIIFDLDGTIINTNPIWKQATQELIRSHGKSCTDLEHTKIHDLIQGAGLAESCAIIKQFYQLDVAVEDLVKVKSERALQLYSSGIEFINGFRDFHALVLHNKLHSAVATNADKYFVSATDKVLNLQQFFGNHIYSMSHVNDICKPDPAVYLHAAEQLRINPKECIAIEDSSHGVQAAKNAGMFCIGIATGNRYHVANADLIVDTYNEIKLETFLH